MLEYRSIVDLNNLIIRKLGQFHAADLDLVVGIPRSGMLPANLLALYLHLPLIDLDGYVEGREYWGGQRMRAAIHHGESKRTTQNRKVLIVDDSYSSGRAMKTARERIQNSDLNDIVLYAVAYIHPLKGDEVDIWLEKIEKRVFEWNVMQHVVLSTSCLDIDGVLCRDPLESENDDGERYIQFLRTAQPLYRPSYRIGWLVTSRLEKYRSWTEEWLRLNSIEYENLVMLNLSSKEERIALGCHAEHKGNIYKHLPAELFIESDAAQASKIATLSRKPVFCTETRQMHYHDTITRLKNQARAGQFIRFSAPYRFLARETRPARRKLRQFLHSISEK